MKYVSKKFLNNSANESGSIVLSAITPKEGEKLRSWSGVDGDVKISDCSRFITLDFSIFSDSDCENRLAKVQVMIDELTAFRDHLQPMWEQVRDNRPARKEKDDDDD